MFWGYPKKVMGRKAGKGRQRTPSMSTVLQRAMTHSPEAVLLMTVPRKGQLLLKLVVSCVLCP